MASLTPGPGALTPDQLRSLANKKEQDEREYEQKKYIELSREAKLYKAALHNAALDQPGGPSSWDYEEFDPDENKEERDFAGVRSEIPDDGKLKAGVYTRKGASKGVIFDIDDEGNKSFRPNGDEWLDKFDENGWRETIKFAKEKTGSDTLTFEIDNLGKSSKFFGWETNHARKRAIEQLEGVMELAREEGVAINLGKNAKQLVAELSYETDGNKYKNKEGKDVHYRHYIEEKQQDLRDNRDYQNIKMGLRDPVIRDLKKEALETHVVKDDYLKEVYQKKGQDGVPVAGQEEQDIKLRAEAADKAIKDLEKKINSNDEVIGRLDKFKTKEQELIGKSQVVEVLDKLVEMAKPGNKAKSDRDNAMSKLDKKNKNNKDSVEALIEQLDKENKKIEKENEKIEKDAKDAGNRPLTDKEKAAIDKNKEAIDKNKKSLESLEKMKGKVDEQQKKVDSGKDWENTGRNAAVKGQKEDIAKKAEQRASRNPT